MATTTNTVPKGTSRKSESDILKALSALKIRNFDTLTDVTLTGLKGEPIDDKTYLMERIIELVADLPNHDKVSDTLTHSFLDQLWNDLSHPPQSYLGYDYAFRKADGSNNNIMWPHIGKAFQPYARSVQAKRMNTPRPDPGVVYDAVLERKKFRPHPNNISSVLFYMASIIIHDCFHTSHTDYAISETSSYLDLAPLYGSNLEQQLAVRTMKNGMLKPDVFSDSRIHGFPPGVGVMLIMFNRFHNNVADNLAKIDENGRFSKLLNPDPRIRSRSGQTPKQQKDQPERTPEQDYDEALFQTARLITTGLYVNIILTDYVRTILGLNRVDSLWNLDPRSQYGKAFLGKKIPEAGGNQVSAEFSLVYRWHSCVSERDDKWTKDLIDKAVADTNIHDPIGAAQVWADKLAKLKPEDRPFENLKRVNGHYRDDELCEIWMNSVDDVAGAFGAAHVPKNLKFVEVLSMMQARSWNLASLNEFREYFKLAPHKTFESINPDPHIAKQLERLYGHPDNVEIYPGIVVESAKKAMSPGSGLCASWTTSRAILADAVALVRGDRFYTVDYTPHNLTNWGFQQASSDLDINHGGVIYKLILNAFPNHIKKNSVYAHFPMVNPEPQRGILKGMHRDHLYDFTAPIGRKVVTGSTGNASEILWNSTPLLDSRLSMAGAPSGAKTKATIKLSFSQAVLQNKDFKAVTTKFYETTISKLWKDKQYELGGYQTIDVVGDVLNAAHATFITSVLGIPISPEHEPDEPHGLLASLSSLFETAFVPNAKSTAMSAANRGWLGWLADSIASKFDSQDDDDDGEAAALGKAAILKMNQVNGVDATKAVWQDILPTSALLLTALSRSTATAVEFAVPAPTPAKTGILASVSSAITSTVAPATTPAKPSAAPPVTLGVRATEKTPGADEGGVVIISAGKMNTTQFTPELELAMKVTEIANEAIWKTLGKTKGIERMPGPQGKIKKIETEGADDKFLNATESDYVSYPVGLTIRWKA